MPISVQPYTGRTYETVKWARLSRTPESHS